MRVFVLCGRACVYVSFVRESACGVCVCVVCVLCVWCAYMLRVCVKFVWYMCGVCMCGSWINRMFGMDLSMDLGMGLCMDMDVCVWI